MIKVVWSDHALSRMQERFGSLWRRYPKDKIINRALRLEVGEVVKIPKGKVVYVVERKREDKAVIVTVHKRKDDVEENARIQKPKLSKCGQYWCGYEDEWE